MRWLRHLPVKINNICDISADFTVKNAEAGRIELCGYDFYV